MFETAFDDVIEKLGIDTESTRLREKLLDSNVGYFCIGKDGKYKDVNDVWLKLYKCTNKKDVIGSDVTLDRTPEGKKQIMNLVNTILAGETVTGERVERVCKDKSIGYHTVSAKPMKDKNGNIVALEGFIIDITPQVKAEKALEQKIAQDHKTNIFYDQISKSMNVGYFRIGKEGFYQEVNNTWLKLYKYDEGDKILGQHYSLSRTKEDFIKLKQSFEKVLSGETIPLGITRRYCKDGTLGYHSITMTPVLEGENIIGVEGFIIDKTDHKHAEEELKSDQV